jgi:hypothetical protein
MDVAARCRLGIAASRAILKRAERRAGEKDPDDPSYERPVTTSIATLLLSFRHQRSQDLTHFEHHRREPTPTIPPNAVIATSMLTGRCEVSTGLAVI